MTWSRVFRTTLDDEDTTYEESVCEKLRFWMNPDIEKINTFYEEGGLKSRIAWNLRGMLKASSFLLLLGTHYGI